LRADLRLFFRGCAVGSIVEGTRRNAVFGAGVLAREASLAYVS